MVVSRLLKSFVIGEPLLTFSTSTESKEIKLFLDGGKDIRPLQQENVFDADGAPLEIAL